MAIRLKFNPSFQSDEEAVANYVVRQQELDLSLSAFSPLSSAQSSPRVLVIAPRGAGKTTLCRRVLAETRRSERLGAAWQAIFLGEESYTVTTPGEFFLECLFQLNDQAPSRALDEAYRAALDASNEDQLLALSLKALRNYASEIGRRLLIIVENFHIILHDQIGTDSDVLLTALRDEALFGVLATSVAQSSAEDGGRLPPDFLQIRLEPLDLQECLELWMALTGASIKSDRIRPLQILTGGSPRLLHILADFMRTPSLQDLMENLNLLIDQNTEYFKSQLDALPTLERKVFASLLDAWDPATAKNIAELARVNTNTASAMLARLSDRGAVIKEAGRGRASIYYASERLFNIYYLMRRRNHPSSRVRALVSFMTQYYDRDELVDTTAILVREACTVTPDRRADYHSTFGEILSRAPESVRRSILAQTPEEFLTSYREEVDARAPHAYPGPLQELPSQTGLELAELESRLETAMEGGDYEAAKSILREMTDLNPEMASAWVGLSFFYRIEGAFDAAVSAAEQAREISPEDPWTHTTLGQALRAAGRPDEAIVQFTDALKLDPNHTFSLVELAECQEEVGDAEAAHEAFARAHATGLLTDIPLAKYARSLLRDGRAEEAEALLREAAGKQDTDNFESRRLLAVHLRDTDQEESAIQILREAAERFDVWGTWADLGAFLYMLTDHYTDAVMALRRALDKGGRDVRIYKQLVHALSRSDAPHSDIAEVGHKVVEAHPNEPDAWMVAGNVHRVLNADDNSEASYRKAIELGGGEAAKLLLAQLLRMRPGRRSEVEALLREVVASEYGRQRCRAFHDLAELLVHNGQDADAAIVAQAAIESNDCSCCMVLYGQICMRQGDTQTAENEFRAALDEVEDFPPALLGLAKLVDPKEAEGLVARAVEADPHNPECLLARAQLPHVEMTSQIEYAKEALKLAPRFIDAHLNLASVYARSGDIEGAVKHLYEALTDLPEQKEYISSFVAAAMALATHGGALHLASMLAEHPNAQVVEPVGVALKLMSGEEPMVAKEVLEVARDIKNKFATQAS